ncbi:MAG: START-like domain-containing protein [Prevotella sp.]
MKRVKIEISRELCSNSPGIIWNLIGTADGLSKWIADDIQQDGDRLTFTWGNVWSHHETRQATIVQVKKQKLFRFKWDDEEEGTYTELSMERSVITNDYMLTITDFAEPGDEDGLRDIWDDNLEKLHHSTGL